jgi:hypothetical protein
MTLQVLLGQSWSDPVALWAGLDARWTMLNEHIPSRAPAGEHRLRPILKPDRAAVSTGQNGRWKCLI